MIFLTILFLVVSVVSYETSLILFLLQTSIFLLFLFPLNILFLISTPLAFMKSLENLKNEKGWKETVKILSMYFFLFFILFLTKDLLKFYFLFLVLFFLNLKEREIFFSMKIRGKVLPLSPTFCYGLFGSLISISSSLVETLSTDGGNFTFQLGSLMFLTLSLTSIYSFFVQKFFDIRDLIKREIAPIRQFLDLYAKYLEEKQMKDNLKEQNEKDLRKSTLEIIKLGQQDACLHLESKSIDIQTFQVFLLKAISLVHQDLRIGIKKILLSLGNDFKNDPSPIFKDDSSQDMPIERVEKIDEILKLLQKSESSDKKGNQQSLSLSQVLNQLLNKNRFCFQPALFNDYFMQQLQRKEEIYQQSQEIRKAKELQEQIFEEANNKIFENPKIPVMSASSELPSNMSSNSQSGKSYSFGFPLLVGALGSSLLSSGFVSHFFQKLVNNESSTKLFLEQNIHFNSFLLGGTFLGSVLFLGNFLPDNIYSPTSLSTSIVKSMPLPEEPENISLENARKKKIPTYHTFFKNFVVSDSLMTNMKIHSQQMADYKAYQEENEKLATLFEENQKKFHYHARLTLNDVISKP